MEAQRLEIQWNLAAPLLSFRTFFIPGNLGHLAVKGEGLRGCAEGKARVVLMGWPGCGNGVGETKSIAPSWPLDINNRVSLSL